MLLYGIDSGLWKIDDDDGDLRLLKLLEFECVVIF